MSVVREDVWSREDSAEVILERRAAYRTASQCKQLALECWGDVRVLTIWLFIVDFCCFNASNSEFNFLAMTLYSSILVRLSVCDTVSPMPFGQRMT